MYRKKIEDSSLWAWTAAAISAPMAQFLGSVPWHWTLIIGLATGALWLCTAAAAARGPGGKLVSALQILWLVFAVSAAASYCGDCWITARSGWGIPFFLLVLAACAAERGSRSGARCGTVLFWVLAGLFLLLAAFAVPDVKIQWLIPENRGEGAVAAAVLLLPAAAGLLPRERGKTPWGWAVGFLLAAGLISLQTAGVLSPLVASETNGAFFEMIRGVSILGVAERFEAVVSASMTLGWFCLLSLLLTVVGSLAENLREGWGRPAVWVAALAAFLLMGPARMVPAWISALGALLFWCILPLLRRKRKAA